MELKKGDKIICITDAYKDFTKGKEYEIFNIDLGDISVKNDYGVSITFLSFHKNFKLKEETETAYKETEGKLHYELDFEFITQMAERMASNKGKYEPYNWQKLDNIDDLKQSLFRHVLEVMNGNYKDDNRKFGHLEAVAINAMFINYQLNKKEVSPSEKLDEKQIPVVPYNGYFDYEITPDGKFKGILSYFKEENKVSPSSKINTTDSTGLLTEEK